MTISEIASKAGVSAATVSRVLNGKGPVKESTRRLILEIIQQNEYVPSEIARGLSKNNSNNIGVFIPDIENAFFSTAVRGIVERADQFGYNVFLFHTDENVEKEHRYLQTVMGLRIKGLIISPVIESDEQTREWLDRLQSRQVPVVLLDREICGLSLDGVFSQDEEGAFQAVSALIDAGHRRIGIISGPDNTRPGRERTAGYLRALRTHGIPRREAYIQRGNFRMEGSHACTRTLMELPMPPTAIFSANNLSTVGCLQCLNERGLRVGKDVSLIGFDNLDQLACIGLSVSTVDRSFIDMGRQTMVLLQQRLQEIENGISRGEAKRIYQTTRLSLRGSERLTRFDTSVVNK